MKNLDDLTLQELLERLESYQHTYIGSVPHDLCIATLNKINRAYEFVSLCDIAGEAFVFKAIDKIDNRPLAIKVALPQYFSKSTKKHRINWGLNPFRGKDIDEPSINRQRFLNGCELHAALYKEIANAQEELDFYIPKLYNFTEEPCLHAEMEWIDGIHAVRWIKEKKDLIYGLKLYLKLLHATKFFHSYQILHRDLKSNNLLISKKDKITIIDWTVSKLLTRENITIVGTPIGTSPYGSPKNVTYKNARDATYPDDIYSLGYVLYEFQNGEDVPPTELDLSDILQIEKYKNELCKTLLEELKPIFSKATHVSEHQRYQILDEFIDDFKTALGKLEKKYPDKKGIGQDVKQQETEDRIKKTEEMLARIGKFIEENLSIGEQI